MTARSLPYYKWFWQDWRSNRRVQRMSYIERGLYRELLDECWIEGSIPDDIDELAEICGCPSDVMANAWQTLSACFVQDGDRWRNKKLDSVRTELDQRRIKNAENGRKGGIAKAAQILDSVATAKRPPGDRHIEEKRREEGEKKREEKIRRATQLPDDFKSKAEHAELASNLRVDLATEMVKFADHYRARGATMKDWDAALRNWIRKAAEYNQGKPAAKRTGYVHDLSQMDYTRGVDEDGNF